MARVVPLARELREARAWEGQGRGIRELRAWRWRGRTRLAKRRQWIARSRRWGDSSLAGARGRGQGQGRDRGGRRRGGVELSPSRRHGAGAGARVEARLRRREGGREGPARRSRRIPIAVTAMWEEMGRGAGWAGW